MLGQVAALKQQLRIMETTDLTIIGTLFLSERNVQDLSYSGGESPTAPTSTILCSYDSQHSIILNDKRFNYVLYRMLIKVGSQGNTLEMYFQK